MSFKRLRLWFSEHVLEIVLVSIVVLFGIDAFYAESHNATVKTYKDLDTGCEYLVLRRKYITPRTAANGISQLGCGEMP